MGRRTAAARTALAVAALLVLFAHQVRPTVRTATPPVDEVTWAARCFLPWYPGQWLGNEEAWARDYPGEYYCYIHHPSVTRLVYRTALALRGVSKMPDVAYNYALDHAENLRIGNYLPSRVRIPMRATNAVFVLAAVLLVFFGMLSISGNRALAALATLPIIYEPTITKTFNSCVGYVGTDAILLFFIVLFWFAWLKVGRGASSAALLGFIGGLAASTKYIGALLVVAAIAYYALTERGRKRVTRPLLVGAISIAVFLALNPIYLGTSISWPLKVLRDTFVVMYRMQVDSAENVVYSSWMITDHHEVALMLLPYLPWALPAAVLIASARRSPWFGRTVVWSGVIIAAGLAGYILFIPTYAAPCRAAFLVTLCAAALQKIRDWQEGREKDATNVVREDVASDGLVAGTGRWAALKDARLSWMLLLVPPAAAIGVLSPAVPAYVYMAAMPVAVFAGVALVLRGAIKSAAVVLPLALMIPCFECPEAASMIRFSLGAAMFWALSMYLDSRRADRTGVAVAAIGATAALSISPHSFVFAIAAALGQALPLRRKRFAEAAALILPLALAALAHQLTARSLPPDMRVAGMWKLFDWRHAEYWNVKEWMNMAHSDPFDFTVVPFNQYIYVPIMGALGVLAYRWRREWWFGATFIWAAMLFLGARIFTKGLYVQYSLPMEMALLIPFGIAAVREFEEMGRAAVNRRCESGKVGRCEGESNQRFAPPWKNA